MQIVQQDDVQARIIEIRNEKVLIDADVAELYGVETKRINEAVKNNPEKFHEGYLFELNKNEKNGTGRKPRPVRKAQTFYSIYKGFYRARAVHASDYFKKPKSHRNHSSHY